MYFPKTIKFFAVLILISFAAACTPEEVKTNTELLTEAQWVFENIESTTLSADDLAFYAAILGDTQVKYNTDGTYDVSFVDNAFDPYSGTWAFQDEETKILQDAGTDDEGVITVVSLDEGAFTYAFSDSVGTHNINWSHIE